MAQTKTHLLISASILAHDFEKVIVRTSRSQDTDDVFSLASNLPPLTPHTWYTYWNLFNNFGNSCFIAQDEGKPVGFMTSHPTTSPASEWFIWQAGLLPEYRGQGLIYKLQDRVVDSARQAGAIAIRTTIEADNPRSLGAFSKMAFRLGTNLEELDRFKPGPEAHSDIPEVLYRIKL